MPIKKTTHNIVPKYIIQNNRVVIGKVAYHKDLITGKIGVQGGGMFIINHKEATLLLYGDSYKLGPPDMDALKKAVKNWKIYTNKSCKVLLDDKFTISIKTRDGIITLN